MVKVYTEDEYSIAYTELIEILKYFPKSDLLKIPKDIILNYINYKNSNYNFFYNPDLEIDEQNVSKLTQILLANLYIDYLADKDEQEYIKNRDAEELLQLEKQKQEQYNIETIFNNRKEKSIKNNTNATTSLSVISSKENIFKKLFFKIKCFLKLSVF